jgi:hypothetical protein
VSNGGSACGDNAVSNSSAVAEPPKAAWLKRAQLA